VRCTNVFRGGVQPLIAEAETTSGTLYKYEFSYVKVDEDEDGTYDYVEITGYEYFPDAGTEAEIPSEIDGLPVTSIGDGAFYFCESLTSITIGDSVTSIGDSAFYSCTYLARITIPDSVASIGYKAFYGCDSLRVITIENPECKIYDSENTITGRATIYGYWHSTAHSYASMYNRYTEIHVADI